ARPAPTLERAARTTKGGLASTWETSFWAGTALMLNGAARHVDARPWGGGVRRDGARPCVSARGAPRISIPKELTEECLRGGSAPPNDSRLSCGAPTSRAYQSREETDANGRSNAIRPYL